MPPVWSDIQDSLSGLAAKQIFFVGGPPRSGTTWLQQMLNSHPHISCRGEGLFHHHLAQPLEGLMTERSRVIAEKNRQLFTHTGGYPLPPSEDVDFLLRTAILLSFRQYGADEACRAIGEKTPENVFSFPRLKRLFRQAKLIAIVRDPRDTLASAWHLFQAGAPHADEGASKRAFVSRAIPVLGSGVRAMLDVEKLYPDDCAIVTYENFKLHPSETLTRLFRFLCVSDAREIVDDCLDRTSFENLTGARPTGTSLPEAFLRKGVVGDWQATFTREIGEMIVHDLGWTFARFDWKL